MGFAWCLRRSALRLVSSECGGRVRSISTFVNRRPSFVHDKPSPLRPLVSRVFLSSTAATDDDDDDDPISSEQAVLRELDLEFNPLAWDKSVDPLTGFITDLWRDPSRGKMIPDASFPFKVEEDIPGNGTFTLTRECNGEHIKVVVSIHFNPHTDDESPMVDDDDAPSNESDGAEDAPSNESDDDDDSRFKTPLVVTVTKKSGRSLELRCRASDDEITVDYIHVILPGHGSEDLEVIRDMDYVGAYNHEPLKESFNKYLKIRGLTRSTIRTINSYMLNKQRLEYWFWLDHVKEFLEE